MTQPGYFPSRTGPESAMDEAADVGKSAAARAGDVTEVIGEQAKQVASETGAQARNLLDESLHQLRDQARNGQQKLAEGLRNVADQLRRWSDRTEEPGMATDLVRQATDRTEQVASWLEAREPGDLVDEIRRFARRRPGMFLAGATLAGVLAGRLTRNVAGSAQSDGPDRQRAATPDRRPEPPDAAAQGASYPPTGAGYGQQVPASPMVQPTGPGPVR